VDKKIWKIYLEENSEGFASLLFMDHANMHVKENIIEEIEKFDTKSINNDLIYK
jgi:hypothetical protein